MEDQEPIKEEAVGGSKHLYIVFGGIASNIGMPPFEFYQASKILNETRVFIRDVRQCWYHAGLPGVSTDIITTARFLERLIGRHSPEAVTMVGNSMGGFAALLFSSMIGNTHAVAFAPQTFISPVKRFWRRDSRWRRQIMQTYRAAWYLPGCWDLAKLKPRAGWSADVFVSKRHELDYVHATNLRGLPGVCIHEYAKGGHNLVKELRDSGELATILRRERVVQNSGADHGASRNGG